MKLRAGTGPGNLAWVSGTLEDPEPTFWSTSAVVCKLR